MYEQNKNKLLLRKILMTALNGCRMLVQEGLEWFFDPKLNAPPDGRVAESSWSTQADMGKLLEAAESAQAAMRKHIEDLQRELVAVKDLVDKPCAPEVLTTSDLAATPAALDAFDVEENIAVAFDILQLRIPLFPYPNKRFRIKIPNVVPSYAVSLAGRPKPVFSRCHPRPLPSGHSSRSPE